MKRLANLSLLGVCSIALLVVLHGPDAARADRPSTAPPARPPAPNAAAVPAPPTAPPADPFAGFERLVQSSGDARLTPELRGGKSTGAKTARRHARVSQRLSPEMIDLCMKVAEDVDADLARKLRALRKGDVVQFEAQLRRSRRLVSLAEVRKRDPIAYDLKLQELKVDAAVNRLAGELRRARSRGQTSEAKALEAELRPQVIFQIALRHNNRDDYLCRLRELVERLERELQAEKEDLRENFNEVLERRMTELMRDPAQPADESGTDGRPAAIGSEHDAALQAILPG